MSSWTLLLVLLMDGSQMVKAINCGLTKLKVCSQTLSSFILFLATNEYASFTYFLLLVIRPTPWLHKSHTSMVSYMAHNGWWSCSLLLAVTLYVIPIFIYIVCLSIFNIHVVNFELNICGLWVSLSHHLFLPLHLAF